VKTFLLRGFRLECLFPRNRALENYLLEREDHGFDMEVDWCLGSCLMIRREALNDVGLLDENYFMYYEDIDLCYRMKQNNWKVVYIASAEMIHHYRRLSASIPPNQYSIHHLKSALYFFWKFRKQRGLKTLF
jgi:GT2 family glycosyltransferase